MKSVISMISLTGGQMDGSGTLSGGWGLMVISLRWWGISRLCLQWRWISRPCLWWRGISRLCLRWWGIWVLCLRWLGSWYYACDGWGSGYCACDGEGSPGSTCNGGGSGYCACDGGGSRDCACDGRGSWDCACGCRRLLGPVSDCGWSWHSAWGSWVGTSVREGEGCSGAICWTEQASQIECAHRTGNPEWAYWRERWKDAQVIGHQEWAPFEVEHPQEAMMDAQVQPAGMGGHHEWARHQERRGMSKWSSMGWWAVMHGHLCGEDGMLRCIHHRGEDTLSWRTGLGRGVCGCSLRRLGYLYRCDLRCDVIEGKRDGSLF